MALRPRLSPGSLLSRCRRYARLVYRGCQATREGEPEGPVSTVHPRSSRPEVLQTHPKPEHSDPEPGSAGRRIRSRLHRSRAVASADKPSCQALGSAGVSVAPAINEGRAHTGRGASGSAISQRPSANSQPACSR
jgi:hypothetical protein